MFSSFSDSALSAFRWWVSWFAAGGSAIGVVCAVLTILTTRETSRRADAKADKTASALRDTQEKLVVAETSARETKALAEQLELRQRPRRLLKDKWSNLAAAAKFPPGTAAVVNGSGSDPEAATFARDVSEFLVAAGVMTELNLPLVGGDLSAPSGVVIFKSRSATLDMRPLSDALNALGIRCEIKTAGFDGKPDFAFTIAAKPLTN